ncbi:MULTISPECIES: hypothetical protein [Mycobacteriaceae]|nr:MULTISPECIES: hypothetical protein [Mycobacteriaceae]MCX8556192.1 hypothetical protein [Mycolicibacterium mucogenicum]SHU95446.1 Uncharacterised protein [Mycobacteroides abscessus subsp. abscessus]SHU98901.1 Uncharacterised protein [Mycobacteroides abscessus subsp. abscessus]SHV59937.1 Uncharacterised protein [Mycobacteroides abscessus subsp. abscessus]SHV82309.1 Uncharacterised protein [Mycobacteroides abscessus subsp. abscessus]
MTVLEDGSKHAEREEAFAAERVATLAEAEHPAAIEEGRDWGRTAADGID